MAQADLIGALTEVLKADAEASALAGARVFGGELPGAEAASMPRAACVLRASGGVSLAAGSRMAHDTQRIDLVCFGATSSEASGLLAVCGAALRGINRQLVSGCLIHWAEPAGGFFSRRDTDTKWPFAFQPFQIFHALQEAA